MLTPQGNIDERDALPLELSKCRTPSFLPAFVALASWFNEEVQHAAEQQANRHVHRVGVGPRGVISHYPKGRRLRCAGLSGQKADICSAKPLSVRLHPLKADVCSVGISACTALCQSGHISEGGDGPLLCRELRQLRLAVEEAPDAAPLWRDVSRLLIVVIALYSL